jgi:chitin disaccharide deacetylase
MTKLIINADDFGCNSPVNRAIANLFNRGLINSTTIMANMPGFEEAVNMAFDKNFVDKIGIHLVLTEGMPLTINNQSLDLYNSIRNKHFSREWRHLLFRTKNEKKLIFEEFGAQIEKVRKTGIGITHIDSHHHIHEFWPVTRIVMDLLKKYNIPSMRITNNLNRSSNFYKTMYRDIVNKQIRKRGVAFTDFFGNQLVAISQFQKSPSIFENRKLEIMVHPCFSDKGIIIDKINGREYELENSEDLKRIIALYS